MEEISCCLLCMCETPLEASVKIRCGRVLLFFSTYPESYKGYIQTNVFLFKCIALTSFYLASTLLQHLRALKTDTSGTQLTCFSLKTRGLLSPAQAEMGLLVTMTERQFTQCKFSHQTKHFCCCSAFLLHTTCTTCNFYVSLQLVSKSRFLLSFCLSSLSDLQFSTTHKLKSLYSDFSFESSLFNAHLLLNHNTANSPT